MCHIVFRDVVVMMVADLSMPNLIKMADQECKQRNPASIGILPFSSLHDIMSVSRLEGMEAMHRVRKSSIIDHVARQVVLWNFSR